jgi:hypothetical protein
MSVLKIRIDKLKIILVQGSLDVIRKMGRCMVVSGSVSIVSA